jgi:hypothetical protein
MVMGEHHLTQGLDGIRDAVAGAVADGDRVESLLPDHCCDADASATDLGDVQATEERASGAGIDGVGADRELT